MLMFRNAGGWGAICFILSCTGILAKKSISERGIGEIMWIKYLCLKFLSSPIEDVLRLCQVFAEFKITYFDNELLDYENSFCGNYMNSLVTSLFIYFSLDFAVEIAR